MEKGIKCESYGGRQTCGTACDIWLRPEREEIQIYAVSALSGMPRFYCKMMRIKTLGDFLAVDGYNEKGCKRGAAVS